MGRVAIPREEVFTSTHPEYLRERGQRARVRVDHEIADRLQQGTGTWTGDPRLALYANVDDNTWELWRLEHDGKYRMVGRQQRPGPGQRGQSLGEELLNTILTHLVEVDVRNGHDPVDELIAAEEEAERRADADFSDWVTGDFADRFAHALRQDGADDHVTGYG